MTHRFLKQFVFVGVLAGAAACGRADTTTPAGEVKDRLPDPDRPGDPPLDATKGPGERAGEATRDAGEATRDAGERAGERTRDAGERAREATRDAGDRAGERTRDAGDRAGEATRDAGDRAGRAAGTAANRAGGAVETADVKMALMNDDAVDASDINVDTNSQTKVVTLKGFVRSAEHRARAEAIAKREATGYRVNNQLTVRGSR